MDAIRREGQRPSVPGDDHDSRALDRFEDEGGPGPRDTRGRRAGAPTSAPTGGRDVVDRGEVVVAPGVTAVASRVHHRDIPELQADGATGREADANLARGLTPEIDEAADHRRRERFGRVTADIRAFGEGP